MNTLESILEAYKVGDTSLANALQGINDNFFSDLGHSTLDIDRQRRNGAPEIIYGEHKTAAQIVDLVAALVAAGQNVLVTRTSAEVHQAVQAVAPGSSFNADARTIQHIHAAPEPATSSIVVVTAGTSDLPVAAEAAQTAEFLGNPVTLINDVGVAGIHRLLNRTDVLRSARVLIVVAGMEGALPSVVGGLVDKPVIAVPTSVGYGAAFGGIAALLGMLNTCASGVSVVNIDNGFGAGYLANMINRL